MKIGFVTCVKLGLSCIQEIYSLGYELSLIITLKDDLAIKKSGRIFLDEFCKKNNVPLLKINHINDEQSIKLIKKYNLDWLFIIGWSQIANNKILSIPKQGAIGAHPTLLPIGRGRASIPWAIIKGLKRTGVTFFKLDSGVDTGPIISQKVINLQQSETASNLYKKVNEAHIYLINDLIKDIFNNKVKFVKQNEKNATYWPQRKPEDGEINIKDSVYEAHKLIRALQKPYPGAFFFNEQNQKVIVWEATITNKISDNNQFLEFKDGILQIQKSEIND